MTTQTTRPSKPAKRPRTPARRALLSCLVLPALLAAGIAGAIVTPGEASAQSARVGANSGLPLPRFVSLKSRKANLRVGPGRDYRVEWVITRPGLPVEIVQEFDNWRRIRDAEGTEGWVFGALLSGRRTAVVAPWLAARPVEASAADLVSDMPTATMTLRRDPSPEARAVARLEPGVVGAVEECSGEWCRFAPHADGKGSRGKVSGWIRQVELWGAYPGERFGD